MCILSVKQADFTVDVKRYVKPTAFFLCNFYVEGWISKNSLDVEGPHRYNIFSESVEIWKRWRRAGFTPCLVFSFTGSYEFIENLE